MPIRDWEGVSLGCGFSNPPSHLPPPLDMKQEVSGKVAGDGLHCGSAITTRTGHTSNTPTRRKQGKEGTLDYRRNTLFEFTSGVEASGREAKAGKILTAASLMAGTKQNDRLLQHLATIY